MTPTTSSLSVDRAERIRALFVCPKCKGKLTHAAEALTCPACHAEYPIVAGRAVFAPEGRNVTLINPEHVSHQAPPDVLDRMQRTPGWCLNIGAGACQRKIDNLIELEYSLFPSTDVSADAHHLPFADNTFDAIITYNTFEHLYAPHLAASEIYRVLKPGGDLTLETAFLQPLHEAPHHYYDCTEFGLRKWFEQFQIDAVTVPPHDSPAYALALIAMSILHCCNAHGPQVRRLVGQTTLEQWALIWSNPGSPEAPSLAAQALAALPEDLIKIAAAGFNLRARKPKTS
jgi:SAM-dependent methyltransferase